MYLLVVVDSEQEVVMGMSRFAATFTKLNCCSGCFAIEADCGVDSWMIC